MSENSLSTVEAFHNGFFYFVESLSTMALDAAKQCEAMAGVNAAWELQNDVLDHGKAVLNCAGSFLAQEERAGIVALLAKVEKLSSAAIGSDAEALHHPEWDALRNEAARLLIRLARSIAENQAFFEK